MARLDEIAEGLSSLLQLAAAPEPLGVNLVGHSPAEVTFLVRAVVDACARRGTPIALIRLGSVSASNAVRTFGPEPLEYDGVKIEIAPDLDHRIELH